VMCTGNQRLYCLKERGGGGLVLVWGGVFVIFFVEGLGGVGMPRVKKKLTWGGWLSCGEEKEEGI